MSYEFMQYQIENQNGNTDTFTFVNETWETSRSWGHRTLLFRNGAKVGEHKIRYYNRTWERFQYQSCMGECVYQIMTNMILTGIETYKRKHNVSRFKRGEKENVIVDFKNNNAYYKELKELYERIYG